MIYVISFSMQCILVLVRQLMWARFSLALSKDLRDGRMSLSQCSASPIIVRGVPRAWETMQYSRHRPVGVWMEILRNHRGGWTLPKVTLQA